MRYLKSEHYLMNYDTNIKESIGTFYATRELALEQNKILLTGWGPGKQVTGKYFTLLEAKGSLNFKNFAEGDDKPISAGRFLNNNYEEMLFSADLPEKGLSIEGVISKVSDKLFVSTKTVKRKDSDKPNALIQEIIHIISKEEFEKAIA